MVNPNFKDIYNQWQVQFDSEDKNCIIKQIQYMFYETLIYKCILKSRSLAPKDSKDRIKLNGAVHYLIDKCFFNNQLMTIRRLAEPRTNVISLVALLEQMKKNSKYLTRQNYFDILEERGYKYDYLDIKKRCDAYISKNLKLGEVIGIPDDLDWEKSEKLHVDFDILSKTNSSNRKPDDTICKSVFNKLIRELECCADLKDHINAFLAHSKTPEEIKKIDNNSLKITFGHLWEAQQNICKVTRFISLYLLGRVEVGLLPFPHGSFMQYIEEPLVSKEGKSELYTEQDQFRDEVSSWVMKIDDLWTGPFYP